MRAEICPVGSVASLFQLRRSSSRLFSTLRRRDSARGLFTRKLCGDTGKSRMESTFGKGSYPRPALPAAHRTGTLDGTGFLRQFRRSADEYLLLSPGAP